MKAKRTSKINLLVLCISMFCASNSQAQVPFEHKEIVEGGQFKDLILPMPIIKKLSNKNLWGTEAVLPRDADNGLEDNDWCYWGGNPMLGDDGKYHIAIARWPESKGHWGWPKSEVAHAESKHVLGPYKVTNTVLTEGHNPEVRRLNDGTYMLHISKGNMYTSDNITGPWTLQGKIQIDQRGHQGLTHLYTNLTGLQRQDGSFLFFTKRGDVMISTDGLTGPYKVVSSRNYDRYTGYPEDPIIWKSLHQYHVIFNHAVDKKSVYMRSLNGIHWKVETGQPYDKTVFRYSDGTTNEWCKFERPKVVQDALGRATHLSLAVIDVEKKAELPNDNHSSKHVILPLLTERIAEIVNPKKITAQTQKVIIKIKAEASFHPEDDIIVESLRLGVSDIVNYGGGAKAIKSEVTDGDLLVTFEWDGSAISKDNYDLKLLGKSKTNALIYAYALLPEYSVDPASLVTLPLTIENDTLTTEVENFGLQVSTPTGLKIYKIRQQKRELVKQFEIPALAPYERFDIQYPVDSDEDTSFEVVLGSSGEDGVFWNKVDDNHYSVVYKGTWKQNTQGRNLYLGSEQTTSEKNASAAFFFHGSQAQCYGHISRQNGSYDVYIDDVYIERVDCYFGADLHNVVVYQTDVLPKGLHKLELRATGLHYKGKPEGPVTIDAFSYK